MPTKKEKNLRLGQLGEDIVKNLLNDLGKKVKISIDPYDSKKDITVDGITAEIKTQVPFVTRKLFSFKDNQTAKVSNAGILYVVSVGTDIPGLKWRDKTAWGIFECINPGEISECVSYLNEGELMKGVEFRFFRKIGEVPEEERAMLSFWSCSDAVKPK